MGTNGDGVLTKGELLQASKAIHDQLGAALKDQLKDLELELVLRVGKVLERKFGARLKELEAELRKSMQTDYNARVQLLERTYEQGFAHMKALFAALPAPAITVTIPEGSIRAVVPKDAIHVQVESKTLLEAPARKSVVSKSIVYDQATGRPSEIIEKTHEE